MKVLDPSMLDFVSGGRGNNGGDRVDNGGKNNSRNNNSRGAPKTAANDAAVAGLLTAGAAAAAGAGPFGIAVAGVAAGVVAALGSPSNGGRDHGAFGGNNNPNSVNGQCRW
ncbi:hypothetical protein [Serratia ficaria]|uniref:hypothetical protein n=1 Tax=Serratia ficaria TaxID=61651 RepID=UPI0012B7F6EA|nr:hypothetical protein [Serratia ficaria]